MARDNLVDETIASIANVEKLVFNRRYHIPEISEDDDFVVIKHLGGPRYYVNAVAHGRTLTHGSGLLCLACKKFSRKQFTCEHARV